MKSWVNTKWGKGCLVICRHVGETFCESKQLLATSYYRTAPDSILGIKSVLWDKADTGGWARIHHCSLPVFRNLKCAYSPFAVGRIWAFGVYVVIATTGMPLHFCFLWECWSLYSPQTLGVIRGCRRLTLSWASTIYLLPSDAWEHFSAFVEVHGLSVMEQLCSRVTFPRSKSYLHVPFGLSHGWPEKVWELLYLDSSVASS